MGPVQLLLKLPANCTRHAAVVHWVSVSVINYARFDVFMALEIKVEVSWVVTQTSLTLISYHNTTQHNTASQLTRPRLED
jgi:hypothetical protein